MDKKAKIGKEERCCFLCGKILTKRQTKYCSPKCHYDDPKYKKLQSDLKKILHAEHPEKGKEHSERLKKLISDHPEMRYNASKKSIKQFSTQKGKDTASKAQLKSFAENPERGENLSKTLKIICNTSEYIENQRQIQTQYCIDHPEKGLKISEMNKVYNFLHPEKAKKHSEDIKEKCKDPEYARKTHRRANITKPERKFLEITETNHFPFFFNGYLQNENPVIIGTRIPDFVHNTDKKIVEIYGDYYHANPNRYKSGDIVKGTKVDDIWIKDEQRIKEIQETGYQILIIWDSELKDETVIIQRVKDFISY